MKELTNWPSGVADQETTSGVAELHWLGRRPFRSSDSTRDHGRSPQAHARQPTSRSACRSTVPAFPGGLFSRT